MKIKRKGGFTLIEMLVVILIVGFLIGILAIRASDVGADAKKKAVAADLKSLKSAVEIYYVEYSQFPIVGSLESALVEATPRLIDEVPTDPYGSGDYGYKLTNLYYVIYSVGPDGAAGTIAVAATNNGTVSNGGDNLWVSNCANENHNFD